MLPINYTRGRKVVRGQCDRQRDPAGKYIFHQSIYCDACSRWLVALQGSTLVALSDPSKHELLTSSSSNGVLVHIHSSDVSPRIRVIRYRMSAADQFMIAGVVRLNLIMETSFLNCWG